MTGNRKFQMVLPVIAFLAQKVREKKFEIDKLLSFLYDFNKPLTYFGRTLETFDIKPAFSNFHKFLYEDSDKIPELPQLANTFMYMRKSKFLQESIIQRIQKHVSKFENNEFFEKVLDDCLFYVNLQSIIILPDGSRLDRSQDPALLKCQVALKQLLWETIDKNLNFRRGPYQ
jgi:hypothetical protein